MTTADRLPDRALPVRAQLDAAGIRNEIRVLPDSAPSAAAAAAAIGCDVAAIANSLVLLVDDAPTLVMTSGGHRVDFDVLAANLGATRVRMAPADRVRAATGQVIGGVAPVGHPQPLPTYIDEALAAHETLWAAAGHPHTVMPLTFDELQRITGGELIAVA